MTVSYVENLLQMMMTDVRLHVLGCRVDILGTNCNRLLQISRPAIYRQAMPGKSQVS